MANQLDPLIVARLDQEISNEIEETIDRLVDLTRGRGMSIRDRLRLHLRILDRLLPLDDAP